ncbi:uncharacterized protein [Heterodontus francisci]|uniref:uncharacterized protein isoform X2 n=1 Tax=Heterodontus francisci TaxID=7792 RepID=UPI00355B2C6E
MSFLGACALSHLIQVVVSQTVLSQSPLSQTVPMGSLVKLNCHTERLVASLVLWYRQQQWRDMQLVYKVGQYLPADGRFSAGPPAVFLLTPPPDEIPSIERVPLICLVRGLSPHSFPIRWNVSGRVIEGQTDSGTIDEDGTYSVRSHISVPVESWSSGVVCTCTVQINSTENPISESVSSQRGSPLHTSCDLPIYLSSLAAAALLLLGMVVFTAGRSCRKRQSGNMNSDEELPNSRPRVQEKETLYARLAFNENPKL